MFNAKEILHQNLDWITLVFFIILILLTLVKHFFNNRLIDTNTLFLSKKFLTIYFNKEKKIVFNWFQTLLFIIQVIVISLFLYLILTSLPQKPPYIGFYLFLFIAAITMVYFCIRFLIGVALANIFDLTKYYRKILYEKISYFNNLILWMLPLILFTTYAQEYQSILLKTTIVIFIFLLILRYVLILKNNKNLILKDLFYFILYICTLELAPLVIIYKLTT